MTVHLLCPGALDQRTGGYLYDARIVAELRASGVDVVVHELPGDWPFPDPVPDGLLAAVPPGEPVLADGLLWTGLGELGAALCRRNPVVVLVHSPLFREAPPEAQAALRERERAALRPVARAVVTSPWTSRDLGIDAVLVPPGTDPLPRSAGTGRNVLLVVATLTRRKGHRVLLEALARLVDLPWTLRCAGEARNPAEAARIEAAIRELGLADRVALLGDLAPADVAEEYAGADLLVHPAHYEAWGMAVAEAVAAGLPIVSTPSGALDTVGSAAALVVPPGNPAALAEALRRALTEPDLVAQLRAGARETRLPTWSDAARALRAALEEAS